MENFKAIYDRKTVYGIILVILAVSLIGFGPILTVFVSGAIVFLFMYRNPVRFGWLRNELTIFNLNSSGIKLYGYDRVIPWKDIESYHIKFGILKYYLNIKIRDDVVMTPDKKAFYDRLANAKIIKEPEIDDKLIQYPYFFLTNSNDVLKSKIEAFLLEHSSYYKEASQDKLEITKGAGIVFGIGLVIIFIINIMISNGLFFLVTCAIGIPMMYYVYIDMKNTTYLILTRKGFIFPQSNFKLDWKDIKLVEVQKQTRDTTGALVVWLNDVQSFIDENPTFYDDIDNLVDYDLQRFNKTGRLKVTCSNTELGEDDLRSVFQKYIDKYGEEATQSVKKQDAKIQNKEEEKIEEPKPIVFEKEVVKEIEMEVEKDTSVDIISTIDENMESTECTIELQKLVQISFKSVSASQKIVILKEEQDYCLAARIEGLQIDGYCIFLKEQIRSLSYYPALYNELLQREYYFKLNTDQYINLENLVTVFDNYQVKKHYIGVVTSASRYIGRFKEISQEAMVLEAINIEEKGSLETVSIKLSDIISVSYEASELLLLDKYS